MLEDGGPEGAREATYLIQWHPWQQSLAVAASTALVLCLLVGAVLYRVNRLIDAGLQPQYICTEKPK